jgi:hypothetical protein
MPLLREQPGDEDDPQSDRLTPADVDLEAVARISSQAELKDIRLSFLHADWTERDGAIPSDWTTDAVLGLSAEAKLDRADGALTVWSGFVALYAPGFNEEGGGLPEPRDAPLELHAQFELAYKLTDLDAVRDTDPQHFAMVNGLFHAWPYWRELAHTTTVRMGLAPLLVGTFKIPQLDDSRRQEQRED